MLSKKSQKRSRAIEKEAAPSNKRTNKSATVDVFQFGSDETTGNTRKSTRLSPTKAGSSRTRKKTRQVFENKENVKNNDNSNDNNDYSNFSSTHSDHGTVCPICRVQFSETLPNDSRTIHISKCNGVVKQETFSSESSSTSSSSKGRAVGKSTKTESLRLSKNKAVVGKQKRSKTARKTESDTFEDLKTREDSPDRKSAGIDVEEQEYAAVEDFTKENTLVREKSMIVNTVKVGESSKSTNNKVKNTNDVNVDEEDARHAGKSTAAITVNIGNVDGEASTSHENGMCPVCNKVFSRDTSENEKQLHTNKCLDDSIRGEGDGVVSIIPTTEQEKTDEILARSLQEQERGSHELQTTTTDIIPSDIQVCQFCYKDITRLTIQQRLVHVNSCMDKVEQIEGKNKRELPSRKAKNERKTKAKTTTTAKTKTNESKTAATTKPKKATSRKATVKKQCPICKIDQVETQFLIHIKQCAEKRKLTNYQFITVLKDFNIHLVGTELVPESLPSTSSTASKTTNSRRKAQETCTIVMPSEINVLDRTVIEEHRLNAEQNQDTAEIPSTPTLPPSGLASLLQGKDSQTSKERNSVFQKNEHRKLWNLCGYNRETKNSCFFRTSLHPGIKEISNETFTATQYEKLEDLLDLGGGEEQATRTDEQLDERNGFIADNTEEKLASLQEQTHFGLIATLNSLLESGANTDFTFHCNNSEQVSAHKFVLMLRCDAFKKVIEAGEVSVDAKQYSSTIIGHILRYLYCGSLPTCSVQDCKALYTLADRFEIDVLKEACLILHPNCGKEDRTENGEEEMQQEDGEAEDFPIDELISTFWQQEQPDGEQLGVEGGSDTGEESVKAGIRGDVNSEVDDDSCFSDEEMNLIRDVFRSQRVNSSLLEYDERDLLIENPDTKSKDLLQRSADTSECECVDEAANVLDARTKDSKTISVLINNTIDENVTLESPRSNHGDTLEGGILGDSPNLRLSQRKLIENDVAVESPHFNQGDILERGNLEELPNGTPKNLTSELPQKSSDAPMLPESLFHVPENIRSRSVSFLQKEHSNSSRGSGSFTLSRKSSSRTTASSLEVLASNSVRTELSVSSRTNSHSSYLSVGSAYADTLSIDDDENPKTAEQLLDVPQKSITEKGSKPKNSGTTIEAKHSKHDAENLTDRTSTTQIGEETNVKGHQVTIVGEMSVHNKDEYDKLLTGDEISDVELIEMLDKSDLGNMVIGNVSGHSSSMYILKNNKKIKPTPQCNKKDSERNSTFNNATSAKSGTQQPLSKSTEFASNSSFNNGDTAVDRKSSLSDNADNSQEILFEPKDVPQNNDDRKAGTMATDVDLLATRVEDENIVPVHDGTMEKKTSMLDGTIDSTPIVLSCETPCLNNDNNDQTTTRRSNTSYDSDADTASCNSLENVVIPGLEDKEQHTVIDDEKQMRRDGFEDDVIGENDDIRENDDISENEVIRGEDKKEDAQPIEVTVIEDSQDFITLDSSKHSPSKDRNKANNDNTANTTSKYNTTNNNKFYSNDVTKSCTQNYNADFEVIHTSITTGTTTKVNESMQKHCNGDLDVQEITTGEEVSHVESPCIISSQNSRRINTSTPYSAGATKKQYLQFRKKLSTEIGQPNESNNSNKNNGIQSLIKTPLSSPRNSNIKTKQKSNRSSSDPRSSASSSIEKTSPNIVSVGRSPSTMGRSPNTTGRTSNTTGRSQANQENDSIVIIDSQEKEERKEEEKKEEEEEEMIQHQQPSLSYPEKKSQKRKGVITSSSSSSASESLSSELESVMYSQRNIKQKRKKWKRTSESFTAGIAAKRNSKSAITESSNSDDESVSESDGPSLFSAISTLRKKKSATTPSRRKAAFSCNKSPSTRQASSTNNKSSSTRGQTSTKTQGVSQWLSTSNSTNSRRFSSKPTSTSKKKKDECMNTNDPQHQDDASLSCVLNDGDNQNVSLQLYDDEVAKDDDDRNASILLVDNVNENDGDNATNPFEKNLKEDDGDNRVPTNDDGEDRDTSILLVEKENDGVSNQFDNNVEEDHCVDSNFYKNRTENYGDNLPVLRQLDDNTHENGGDNVNNSKRLDSELNTDVDKNDNTKTYGDDIANPYPENNDVASEDEDQLNAYNDYDGDENENDMYFMDDGGYNSFVMEMPPDENEQAENTVNENVSAASPCHEPSVKNNGDSPSIDESAYELQGEITDAIDNGDNHVTDKNQPLTNVSTNVSCSKACDDKDEEMNKAPHRDKPENESIFYTDIGHDSFDVEAILNAASSTKNRVVPPTTIATTTKTPSTCLTVTTPLNKLHETKRRYLQATETTPGENAEVRIAACKQFRPGCSKHPETNEPITPMPNYADLPTPDLKDKIKKIALRELPKEKMVSKLIEVYKYQHNFSHWEEEPVRAKRKTRKTTKKQQKDARATGTESNENDNDGVPKKKARNQTTTTTKKRTATSTTKEKTITSQSQSTTIVLAQSIMGKPSQKENEEEEREEPRTQSTVYGDETDDTASKSKKTGKKAPKLPLATDEDLFAFIQNDMDVYQKILSYQPIEGNQLFERMKSTASFTASKKAFEQFLDEQCICTKKEENSKPTRKRGRKRR